MRHLFNKRVLFLDDFVSKGDTKERVLAKVHEERSTVVGTYLYRDNDLDMEVGA